MIRLDWVLKNGEVPNQDLEKRDGQKGTAEGMCKYIGKVGVVQEWEGSFLGRGK